MRKGFAIFAFCFLLSSGVRYYFVSQNKEAVAEYVTVDPDYEPYYEIVVEDEETTFPEITTTTEDRVQPEEYDFEDTYKVGVHQQVKGAKGDEVEIRQYIEPEQKLEEIPAEIRTVAESCLGYSERDMIVHVVTRLELKSAMKAVINVNYGTVGYQSVYEFKDGPVCKDDGRVVHTMQPYGTNYFEYWVLLHGVITPDSPEGDVSHQFWKGKLEVTLPDMQLVRWRMWGQRVLGCDDLVGSAAYVWLAGDFTLNDCEILPTEADALGNW